MYSLIQANGNTQMFEPFCKNPGISGVWECNLILIFIIASIEAVRYLE